MPHSTRPKRAVNPYEEMYRAGLSTTTIGRLLGVHPTTVWQWLRCRQDLQAFIKQRGRAVHHTKVNQPLWRYDPHAAYIAKCLRRLSL